MDEDTDDSKTAATSACVKIPVPWPASVIDIDVSGTKVRATTSTLKQMPARHDAAGMMHRLRVSAGWVSGSDSSPPIPDSPGPRGPRLGQWVQTEDHPVKDSAPQEHSIESEGHIRTFH